MGKMVDAPGWHNAGYYITLAPSIPADRVGERDFWNRPRMTLIWRIKTDYLFEKS